MTAVAIPGLDAAPTTHSKVLAWVREVAELTTTPGTTYDYTTLRAFRHELPSDVARRPVRRRRRLLRR